MTKSAGDTNGTGISIVPIPSVTPSFLHGWRFLQIIGSDDPETIPLKTTVDADGPSVVFNANVLSASDLESPTHAMMWLPAALHHICHLLLVESLAHADSIGSFASRRWEQFRDTICHHATMDWSEIISSTRREGIEFTTEHLVACLFCESGIQDNLRSRISGTSYLQVA